MKYLLATILLFTAISVQAEPVVKMYGGTPSDQSYLDELFVVAYNKLTQCPEFAAQYPVQYARLKNLELVTFFLKEAPTIEYEEGVCAYRAVRSDVIVTLPAMYTKYCYNAVPMATVAHELLHVGRMPPHAADYVQSVDSTDAVESMVAACIFPFINTNIYGRN
jgi:uncharacterized protein YjaZ